MEILLIALGVRAVLELICVTVVVVALVLFLWRDW